jgi:hypothetical protein
MASSQSLIQKDEFTLTAFHMNWQTVQFQKDCKSIIFATSGHASILAICERLRRKKTR